MNKNLNLAAIIMRKKPDYKNCKKQKIFDKTAVVHTSLYDPQLNHIYRDLARHYQVAIITHF